MENVFRSPIVFKLLFFFLNQHLKKNSKEWFINWSCKLGYTILKIISSSNGENLVYINDNGDIVKILMEIDNVVQNVITVWQRFVIINKVLVLFSY